MKTILWHSILPLSHLSKALGFRTSPAIHPLTRLLVSARGTRMQCIDGSEVSVSPNTRLLPHDFCEYIVPPFPDTDFVRTFHHNRECPASQPFLTAVPFLRTPISGADLYTCVADFIFPVIYGPFHKLHVPVLLSFTALRELADSRLLAMI